MSPYSFAEGNPIWKLDKSGDSTIYYSQSGVMLWATADKLDNAITIISDKNLVKFQIWKNASIKHKVVDSDVMASKLRQFGTLYETNKYRKFYNENKVLHILDESDTDDPKLIGKPNVGGYLDEVGVDLNNKSGVMTVGKNKTTMGSMRKVPQPLDGSNFLHLHPNEGKIDPMGLANSKVFDSNGKSLEDANPNTGLNVIVSPTKEYLYGGETDQITIDKKSFKEAVAKRK
jgi:hypothetical protein